MTLVSQRLFILGQSQTTTPASRIFGRSLAAKRDVHDPASCIFSQP